MSQPVSAAFTAAAAASFNRPNYGALISWLKTYTSGAIFFTIGTSAIGGTSPIPGAGGAITRFDKYDYVDESPNIESITVERIISSIPIGIMSAQADIELDNTAKRYLPGFDGTIGAYIKAGRPIKLNMGFDAESVTQFVGYTGRPANTLVDRHTSIHAFDAMQYLNGFESSLPMQTNITADAAMALFLIEAGFSAAQYSLEGSLQIPIAFIAPAGKKAGALIRDLAEAECGIAFFDEQGIFRFWNRLHFDLNSTPVAILNYSNLTDISYNDTPVINDAKVTARPRTVIGNTLIYRLSGPLTIQPGQTYRHFVDFSDDDGALPVTTLDAPVYVDNQITSYYATNTASDGTGLPGSGNISVTATYNFGESAYVDFANSSGSQVMYITDLQLYGTPAKILGTIEQEYKDQSSIDDNGLNPDNSNEVLVTNNDYIQDASTAAAYAYNLVTNFAQPRRQITAPVLPNPARQFGDVFTVNIEDTGENLTMVALGTKIAMDKSQIISQSFALEARIFRSYFKIGTSAIGGVDAIPA